MKPETGVSTETNEPEGEDPISIDDLDEPVEEPVGGPVEEPKGELAPEPVVIPTPTITEPDSIPAVSNPNEHEVLRAKLQKSLADLEDIRSEMKTSFTSTDTITSTINAINGMLDALKKDQMGN
jgi:hypothetical protein